MLPTPNGGTPMPPYARYAQEGVGEAPTSLTCSFCLLVRSKRYLVLDRVIMYKGEEHEDSRMTLGGAFSLVDTNGGPIYEWAWPHPKHYK